ncbi:MAG: cyanophycinase [Bacteroidales bacterium]|nr:cyanophycinase [Bacteroidales bacterium]
MRRIFSVFILLLFIVSACHEPEKAVEPKGKLFIIGGGKRPPGMVQRMVQEAGLEQDGHIVILTMASSEPDTSAFYAAKQFIDQGISHIADFRFSGDEEPSAERLDSLRSASLIYITGGDQNRFMEIVTGTSVEEAIKTCYNNGGMLAGTSAGAAVMSEKMITGNELKKSDYRETFRTIEANNIELGRGLGFLTTAIVDQHFVWRSRHNRLITAVIEHPELIGIGIDEATAILVKGNTAEVIGESQVLVYENADKSSTINEDEKLGARYLRLRVLLPGETFRLY